MSLAESVRQRAGNRCQYCLMHQGLQGATFHIEHVIPSSRGGTDGLANLALVCPGCNLRKSDRTTAVDPATGKKVALFRPNEQSWFDHFLLDGFLIRGVTGTGRATVVALELNHLRRQRIRAVEHSFGLFPPPQA